MDRVTTTSYQTAMNGISPFETRTLVSPLEPGAPSTDPASLRSDSPSTSGRNALGKDEFLRLLVSQLSHQDPLNPLQGHEFAAQLAQFSSVEQLLNISNVLAANGEMSGLLAQSTNNGIAAGLIGKTITAAGGRVSLPGEGGTTLSFSLPNAAKSVKLAIKDSNGYVIRTIDLKGRSGGEHEIDWDGLDSSGARVPAGAYSFSVEALDGADAPITAETTISGRVSRVTFGKDGVQVWIGHVPISMNEVQSVAE
jgi:flagellar basal-body rod modification protein FlgD